MTADDVRARVAYIESISGDPECAHAAEDELHRDVLRAFADDMAFDGATMARLALSTEDIHFPRWYA